MPTERRNPLLSRRIFLRAAGGTALSGAATYYFGGETVRFVGEVLTEYSRFLGARTEETQTASRINAIYAAFKTAGSAGLAGLSFISLSYFTKSLAKELFPTPTYDQDTLRVYNPSEALSHVVALEGPARPLVLSQLDYAEPSPQAFADEVTN